MGHTQTDGEAALLSHWKRLPIRTTRSPDIH